MWVNRNLEPDLPMYAAGVHADGKLAVVIVLAKAQPDQMNLYFQNLFSIFTHVGLTLLINRLSPSSSILPHGVCNKS